MWTHRPQSFISRFSTEMAENKYCPSYWFSTEQIDLGGLVRLHMVFKLGLLTEASRWVTETRIGKMVSRLLI